MKTKDFFYHLPEELIAQTPLNERDQSRLLRLCRKTGVISHYHFYDILDFLEKGDVLVVNNSKVLPARMYGKRADTQALVELLLLKQTVQNVWETLVKPGKRCKVGDKLTFGEGLLSAEITEVLENGNRLVAFDNAMTGSFFDILEQIGQMPLPPYITQKLTQKDRYQTVYAKHQGSAAAPTAGLHFTSTLLEKLNQKGIEVVEITLHVGLGTFRPVKVENVLQHFMHEEFYEISQDAASKITEAKHHGKRVIAVGTTSCRTLESVAKQYGKVVPCSGSTDIFIYPGFDFSVIDGLITNFHLPESTLIMLVSAFAGHQPVMNAYNQAVKEHYRFFSFGDAMLIL